jgi:hypothetical protein
MDALLDPWSEFNVALAGATAALAGLVIVAASVNITAIVASRTLTARLGTAVAALVLALVVSCLGLVPAITTAWYGALVLVAAAIAGVFQTATARLILVDRDPRAKARWGKSVIGFLPVLSYLAAGALALADSPTALYAAAAGAVLAIIAGIVVSWVALVEVLR